MSALGSDWQGRLGVERRSLVPGPAPCQPDPWTVALAARADDKVSPACPEVAAVGCPGRMGPVWRNRTPHQVEHRSWGLAHYATDAPARWKHTAAQAR